MTKLQLSICESGAHCANCRNVEKGERFRKAHDLETCPYGKPWNYKTPEKSRGLGDTLKKVFDATGVSAVAKKIEKVTGKPCNCAKRQALANKLVPYKPPAG